MKRVAHLIIWDAAGRLNILIDAFLLLADLVSFEGRAYGYQVKHPRNRTAHSLMPSTLFRHIRVR
jgi:hypothetical protein